MVEFEVAKVREEEGIAIDALGCESARLANVEAAMGVLNVDHSTAPP